MLFAPPLGRGGPSGRDMGELGSTDVAGMGAWVGWQESGVGAFWALGDEGVHRVRPVVEQLV